MVLSWHHEWCCKVMAAGSIMGRRLHRWRKHGNRCCRRRRCRRRDRPAESTAGWRSVAEVWRNRAHVLGRHTPRS